MLGHPCGTGIHCLDTVILSVSPIHYPENSLGLQKKVRQADRHTKRLIKMKRINTYVFIYVSYVSSTCVCVVYTNVCKCICPCVCVEARVVH